MFKDSGHKNDGKNLGLAPNNIPRKLSARDIAIGIGRKATEEELEEYLNRPYGKSISLQKGIEQIQKKLSKKK